MKTVLYEGKWTFDAYANKSIYNDRIISHTIKIGGKYADCVNISYRYHDNKPVSVSIPHLLYEPECDAVLDLEKGGGTVAMIRAAVKFAHSQVPELENFQFDDMSHIDCREKDRTKAPPRKPIMPLNLAYFSIAYHGMTWYEANFNATMTDDKKYTAYKKSLEFLTDPAAKPQFLEFLEAAQPPADQIEALRGWYEGAATYREFFQAIPKGLRCELLYHWLTNFMKRYVKFEEKGWVMNVKGVASRQRGGAVRSTRRLRPFTYTSIHSVG